MLVAGHSSHNSFSKNKNNDPANLEFIMRALMAALGISECVSSDSKHNNRTLSLSGDCNPIGVLNNNDILECSGPDCGNLLNQQSLCAIVAESLGTILRGCDSAINSSGDLQPTGGCNSVKYAYFSTHPVPCDALRECAASLLNFINTMSSIGVNIDTTVESNIINNVKFRMKNSYCKDGIHVSQSAFAYPNYSHHAPDVHYFADNIKSVIQTVVEFIKVTLGTSNYTLSQWCDAILNEIGTLNDISFQNSIDSEIYVRFDALQSLDVNIMNSYIDGVCRVSQSVVFDFATHSFIQSGIAAFETHVPSLNKLRETLKTCPVLVLKPPPPHGLNLFSIGIIVAIVGCLLIGGLIAARLTEAGNKKFKTMVLGGEK